MLSLSLSLLAFISFVRAQSNTSTALEPLVSRHFTYPNLPYQVTGDQGGIRGPQSGYNICNSTTENQESQCQTLIVNSLDDFCMWSSNFDGDTDTIGEGEAREVAWCTKHGHGTRIIPQGTLTGLQLLYAKNYIQIVGYLNQSAVNLAPTDAGGELDPHGADGQGNPLGGVVFTNGFGDSAAQYAAALQANSTPSSSYTQVIEWIDFIGNGLFCIKICNPDDSQAPELCQHIYDLVGCSYNAIADYAAINGTYTVCDSEDMTPVGVYQGPDGATSTWFQPTDGSPAVPPYTPTLIASSNCQTFSSEQLFGTPSPTTTPASSGASSTGPAATGGASGSGSGSSSRSGSGSTPSNTAGAGIATRVVIGATPVLMALGIMLMTIFISLAT